MIFPSGWHCVYSNAQLLGGITQAYSVEDCTVSATTTVTDYTSTSTALRTSTTSPVDVRGDVGYQDWLVVSSLGLFFLSFLAFGVLFSLLKKKHA